MTLSTNGQQALLYAEKNNWKVFPVHSLRGEKCSCGKEHEGTQNNRGKHPRTGNGFCDATDDPETIRKWWEKWPDANIGVATGELSGITVLDVDQHGFDGKENLQRLFKKCNVTGFPITPQANTGGNGWHFFFSYNAACPPAKIAGVGEIKNNGGYIIAAPSNHHSGNCYSWVRRPDEVPLAPLPPWFLDELSRPAKVEKKKETSEEPLLPGERHPTLKDMAVKLIGAGLSSESALQALNKENELRCDPPKPEEEIRDIITWAAGHIEPKSQKQENQPTLLYNMAMMECQDSFCDAQGNAYYETIENSIKRIYQVNNTEFRDFLRRLYAGKKKTLPKNDTIKAVCDQMAAVIRGEGKVKEVFIRLALDKETGDLYLDLANEKREVIRITKDGWEVTPLCPVVFRRGTGQQPLPYPISGGSIDLLRPFINCSDDDFTLVCGFIIGAFQYGKPFILLIVNGEQGSGKSTAGRVIKSLIDPCQALDRALPREEKTIFIAAKSNWIFNYDNASSIQDWMSDALCRVATGGGWGERKKYTDDEEVVYEVKRPVILNGIYDMVERADLMDRAIIVTSLKISDENRLTEAEYYQRFNKQHPFILAAFLDAVVICLRNKEGVNLPQKTRMADFAEWVYAAAPAIDSEKFLSVYLQNREGAREALLQGDLITDSFIRFMDGKLEWNGTANELLEGIKKTMTLDGLEPIKKPKDGRGLTRHLKNIAPNIRKVYYIDIHFPEYTTKNQGRILHIEKIPPDIPPDLEKSTPPDPEKSTPPDPEKSTPILTPIFHPENNIGVDSEYKSEHIGVTDQNIYSDNSDIIPFVVSLSTLEKVVKEDIVSVGAPKNIEGKIQCKNIGVNGVTEYSPEPVYEEGEI